MKKKETSNGYDLSQIVANIEKVKELKKQKPRKPSVSVRPLKFDPDPEDSPLKAEIIRRINAKNLVYSDLYAYCTNLKGGDVVEGQKLGYNIISGLKNRHTFIDTTLTLLADFLKLDILFVDRAQDDSDLEIEDPFKDDEEV